MILQNLLPFDGIVFTASRHGRHFTGKISVDDNDVYFCQDEWNGLGCPDKHGFKYSWNADEGTSSDLNTQSIIDVELFPENIFTEGKSVEDPLPMFFFTKCTPRVYEQLCVMFPCEFDINELGDIQKMNPDEYDYIGRGIYDWTNWGGVEFAIDIREYFIKEHNLEDEDEISEKEFFNYIEESDYWKTRMIKPEMPVKPIQRIGVLGKPAQVGITSSLPIGLFSSITTKQTKQDKLKSKQLFKF